MQRARLVFLQTPEMKTWGLRRWTDIECHALMPQTALSESSP
ncbi:hypothetical protein ACVIN2_005418 [Bradyrhizobium sp. USDA 3650]